MMLPKPDDSFKQAFIAWENQVAELWTAQLRDPDFLKNVWQSVEGTLSQQRRLAQLMQQQLAAMNLPTRTKQAHIQEKIEELQRMAADLNKRIDTLLKEATGHE